MNITKKWRLVSWTVLFVFLALLGSCSSITGPGYYSHILFGEAKILSHRTPMTKLLADKNTPEELQQDLRRVQEMREFAIYELKLPVSDSFTTYADIGRDYATWALTATPEFSVTPKRWCFPVIGCSSYLGFFDEDRANCVKNELVTEGYDVSLRGVLAFSTLGWFADPVMNMHLRVSPSLLAGIIFHETAHERLYIKDDTAYNEAFATFVGHKGQFLWIHKHYGNEEAEKFLLGEKRLEEFSSLITHIRLKLHLMYLEKPPADETRRLKQKIFSELHEKYAALKRSWGGYGGFDEWIGRPPNNADLAGENEYRKLIPFFQKLFELSGKNFPAFYAKAEMIGNFSKMERYLEIEKIMSK